MPPREESSRSPSSRSAWGQTALHAEREAPPGPALSVKRPDMCSGHILAPPVHPNTPIPVGPLSLSPGAILLG